ncbi:MAG: DUF5597 domain-containing protein [Oscillospiraceae bacterium]|nr:DUF5597 domain-containing protein [Oscillospiraceae bacterium]
MKKLSEVRVENGIGTLYVDGKPFIGLGGELHNSSASSTEYMREKIWPALRPLHVNSIVATVSWEQIEPEEGVFDFQIVDDLIADATKEGIKLTIIWFALWKNGISSYVPEWVKLDRKTYWPCVSLNATKVSTRFGDNAHRTISPLCKAAVEADARAFRALMKHIDEVDTEGTVIMMQIENEIGLIGSPRDYSDFANARFAEPVPDAVAKEYGVSGNWREAFGTDAEEYFMAWYYSTAVETIASAGQAEHNIPMYANAWLQQYPDRPGAYPSGGPIMKMRRMWRLGAPTLCMLAPDIYVPYFEKVIAEYSSDGNPLFIPETQTNVRSAATVFLAVCEYNTMGFNPFGIESVFGVKREMDSGFLMSLNINMSAFSNEGSEVYLPKSYELLHSMMDLIIPARGTGKLRGFFNGDTDTGKLIPFSKYDVHVTYGGQMQGKPPAGGAILEVSEDEFYVFGTNFRAEFVPKNNEMLTVEPIRIEEGKFVDGKWVRGRILNGDERRVSIPFMPSIIRIKLQSYETC